MSIIMNLMFISLCPQKLPFHISYHNQLRARQHMDDLPGLERMGEEDAGFRAPHISHE